MDIAALLFDKIYFYEKIQYIYNCKITMESC